MASKKHLTKVAIVNKNGVKTHVWKNLSPAPNTQKPHPAKNATVPKNENDTEAGEPASQAQQKFEKLQNAKKVNNPLMGLRQKLAATMPYSLDSFEIVAVTDDHFAYSYYDENMEVHSPREDEGNVGVLIVPRESKYARMGDTNDYARGIRDDFFGAYRGEKEDEGYPAGMDGAKQYLNDVYGTETFLPVSVYDHSSQKLFVGAPGDGKSFYDPWDTSQIGFIVDTAENRSFAGLDETLPGEENRETVEKMLVTEIGWYNDWVNGEYSYGVTTREHEDGVVGDVVNDVCGVHRDDIELYAANLLESARENPTQNH